MIGGEGRKLDQLADGLFWDLALNDPDGVAAANRVKNVHAAQLLGRKASASAEGPAMARWGSTGPPWILIATILGSSMGFIDGTAVNVSLPVLQRELGASLAQTQWVIESFSLFLSALILTGGALGDRLG